MFHFGCRHIVRAHFGRQLLGHQRFVGCHMQDSRKHDQGQVARGDSQDIQHQKRFHTSRRGPSAQGERMVRRKVGAARLGIRLLNKKQTTVTNKKKVLI